ncbi:MAG: DUF4331 family protein [Sphingobacteriales bacterium]|nr:DUF4331 family protein [Sphingobacteriales bacterium]MBI3719538.1 DUF4331 family protein [Sphingobacteriales bacterium]
MKKIKIISAVVAIIAIAGGIVYAADHIDSPAVTNQATDITDVYAFQAQDANNLVLVANTQGLLAPSATAAAKFDENTLIEFNIDNNGDNVEDLVIQGIAKNGKMYVYGPVKPANTGTQSVIKGNATASVDITAYGSDAKIGTGGGLKVFAGPRDDPFFFDLTQFKHVLAGDAASFNNPGTDTFAGTNVLSLVVELPKSMLGSSNGKINVWLETKKRKNS